MATAAAPVLDANQYLRRMKKGRARSPAKSNREDAAS